MKKEPNKWLYTKDGIINDDERLLIIVVIHEASESLWLLIYFATLVCSGRGSNLDNKTVSDKATFWKDKKCKKKGTEKIPWNVRQKIYSAKHKFDESTWIYNNVFLGFFKEKERNK